MCIIIILFMCYCSVLLQIFDVYNYYIVYVLLFSTVADNYYIVYVLLFSTVADI